MIRLNTYWPSDNPQLTHHPFLLCSISAQERKVTAPLAIEAHVLGEGLSKDNLSIIGEESDCCSIYIDVSTCESLVGHIKEWYKVVLKND